MPDYPPIIYPRLPRTNTSPDARLRFATWSGGAALWETSTGAAADVNSTSIVPINRTEHSEKHRAQRRAQRTAGALQGQRFAQQHGRGRLRRAAREEFVTRQAGGVDPAREVPRPTESPANGDFGARVKAGQRTPGQQGLGVRAEGSEKRNYNAAA